MSSFEEIMMSLDDDHLIEKPKTRETFKRAAFSYPGKKFDHLEMILPHLPVREVWCEAFGGSGVVTLNRPQSKLDVYNDRYSGVVSFFRCIRDETMCQKLVQRLELTLHSREEYQLSKDWEDVNDPVERAAKWYVITQQSFGSVGRTWARGLKTPLYSVNGLDNLPPIIKRFRSVQVENLDWETCLTDYDSVNTVFYLDPPYLYSDVGAYRHGFSKDDHRRLLNKIFNLEGFVALSGYSSSMYDEYDWDEHYSWNSGLGLNAYNEQCATGTIEHLWIKHEN